MASEFSYVIRVPHAQMSTYLGICIFQTTPNFCTSRFCIWSDTALQNFLSPVRYWNASLASWLWLPHRFHQNHLMSDVYYSSWFFDWKNTINNYPQLSFMHLSCSQTSPCGVTSCTWRCSDYPIYLVWPVTPRGSIYYQCLTRS